eukprot:7377967-Prymnesium_polylepis.1
MHNVRRGRRVWPAGGVCGRARRLQRAEGTCDGGRVPAGCVGGEAAAEAPGQGGRSERVATVAAGGAGHGVGCAGCGVGGGVWPAGGVRGGALAERGDCSVPLGHVTVDGYRLGGWVATQRQKHQGKVSGLSESQRSRLEALGMVWDALGAAWEEGYGRLEAYVAEHGDCSVPDSYM